MEEEFYLTAGKIAKILNVSSRTINRYRAEGHVAKSNRGFPLIETVQHYISLLKSNLDAKQKQLETKQETESELVVRNLKIAKLKADIREKELAGDIKELERDRLKKELLDAEEVIAYYSNLVIKARAKFLSLPDKLALELSGMDNQGDIQELLRSRIDECLSQLTSELQIEIAEPEDLLVNNEI